MKGKSNRSSLTGYLHVLVLGLAPHSYLPIGISVSLSETTRSSSYVGNHRERHAAIRTRVLCYSIFANQKRVMINQLAW